MDLGKQALIVNVNIYMTAYADDTNYLIWHQQQKHIVGLYGL